MNPPLVSIIIPIYNVDDYVEDCLVSVIDQSYKNIEILCIEDWSKDRSMEIVSRFALLDSRIKIIQTAKNIGLAATRNVGIRNALGDYLFFLDSDDCINLDAIQKLVMAAMESNADIVYGGGEAFSSEQGMEDKRYIQDINKFLKAPTVSTEIHCERCYFGLKSIPCVAWGKLYKMSFIRTNRLKFIEDRVLHEDVGFHIKCLSCQPLLLCLPNKLYQYRIRSKGLSSEIRNDASKNKRYLELSIIDAIDYVNHFGKGDQFLSFVMDAYWDIFAYKNIFLTYYFGRNEKRLKLFGLNIVKQTSKDGLTSTISVLGIKLFKYSICKGLLKSN